MRPITAISSVILALLLAGCQTTTPTVEIRAVCLPMAEYSLADQREFAAEVANLDPVKDAQVIRFLGDYHQLRNTNKTCQHG